MVVRNARIYPKMADEMSTRAVKRLYDLEIDEVSLVDRPANQHGLVAIAKRAEDGMSGIFDTNGAPVDEDSLEHGDVVYGEDGTEYVFVEGEEPDDDTTAALQSGYDYEDEREPVLVGKAVTGTGSLNREAMRALGRGAKANRKKIGAGAGLAAGGFAGGRMSKGLGESVYEALSKALNDGDRDTVISKVAQELEITKRDNDELREVLGALIDERDDEHYVELAKSYELPVDPYRLGSILKSAAATMSDEDLGELDRLLQSQGALYEELGTAGSLATSGIMDQVGAMALETIGKADVSMEQATVALFEANPAAYDEYLQEG